jgi:Flp pilus assembly protein TadD
MNGGTTSGLVSRSGIRREFWIGCALLVITLIAYWPVRHCGFTYIDDDLYVFRNPEVLPGITFADIRWAFTTSHTGNWLPLTWISHMLDCQFYGTNPAGHHFTNLFFHAANVLLLFAILRLMTGAVWRSAFVAGLFAWHPMHVESVAWIAERKDVLSTFFGLLSLGAYARYVLTPTGQKPGHLRFYIASLFFFAMSLMSKPMLVTLPFLFLLLDYWPLRRCEDGGWKMENEKLAAQSLPPGEGQAGRETEGAASRLLFPSWLRLILEKLPFLALATMSSFVTFLVQKRGGSVTPLAMVPLFVRFANVPMSYLAYIGKLVWPHPLCVLYPFDRPPDPDLAVAAAIFLFAISVAVIRWGRTRPYLPVGWFWFLGSLVPVIGIIQVGTQTIADRYTYLPFVGLFILLVWGMADLAARLPSSRFVLVPIAGVALIACLACTRDQLQYWKDTFTLCDHALAVSGDSLVVLSSEGEAFLAEGKYEEGVQLAQRALDRRPGTPAVEAEVAFGLDRLGRIDEAVQHYRAAVNGDPNLAEPLISLAWILSTDGDNRRTNATEAVDLAERACVLTKNGNGRSFAVLAAAYAEAGRFDEAVTAITNALRMASAAGDHTQVQNDQRLLGLFSVHRPYHLHPSPADAACDEACQLTANGNSAAAAARYRDALRLDANHVESLNNLAWILATDPEPRNRDGAEAMRLATHACELTEYKQPFLIGTLAAAQAEAGQFDAATATATTASRLFLAATNDAMAATNETLSLLYKSGQPYHLPPRPDPP